MARKNNYYLEEAAKRSSAIVITLCVIAIILTVAAILTVLAWGSDGFTRKVKSLSAFGLMTIWYSGAFFIPVPITRTPSSSPCGRAFGSCKDRHQIF
mgnify:CR=1 FL=1